MGSGRQTPLLEEAEPPFLQERTVRIAAEPRRQLIDELVDFTYRWRLALGVGLLPIVLAGIALAYEGGSPSEPVAPAESETQTGSVFGSLLEAPPRAGTGPVTPRADTVDLEGSAADGAGPEGEPPLRSPAPSSSSSAPAGPATTPSTAPATTTTTAQTTVTTATSATATTATVTTATVTTAPPTTASAPSTTPPITLECLVGVGRRADLHAEPDRDSEELARVKRGIYPGFGRTDDGEWYSIDHRGTFGWIRERAVIGVTGDCG